ncbi:F-box/LRR-repeat protein At3g59250-like [Malania oleifera]|uniref:F-box/LRR-repeat protein At3g59250-like n=1 Tax=Malania oleifera TaxID=397392 RepID=UPI0025ADB27D|nr:F-box/LRR-repeat protein At3g59250-like [Malania oleifera]
MGSPLNLKRRHSAAGEATDDRISRLPDSVLSLILSFVPTTDAMRASVLSTRWKHLFASASNLLFDDSLVVFDFHKRGGKRRKTDLVLFNSFVSFVYRVATLTVLKLTMNGAELNVLASVRFSSMKILHLRSMVLVDDGSVKRLFAGCSVLEDLLIKFCNFNRMKVVDISIPTLLRLTIDGRTSNYEIPPYEIVFDFPLLGYLNYVDFEAKGYEWKNLENSLVEAHVNIRPVCGMRSIAGLKVVNFLKGIYNVSSLHLINDYLLVSFLHFLFVSVNS